MNLEAELVFTQRSSGYKVIVFRIYSEKTGSYSLAKGWGAIGIFTRLGFSRLHDGHVFYMSTRRMINRKLYEVTRGEYERGYEFAPHLSTFPEWPLSQWLENKRPSSRDEVKRQRANTRADFIEL